jgi:FixJ family two-component response regulator
MGRESELICIVDDDPSVRRALGRMVRSFGFDVQLIASGRDCLDEPYVDRASCLIVDIMMPNMDGFELHALLAASDREIPTIFLSGQNNQKNYNRAASTDCVAILDKPCDADLLHDTIKKAIAR